jgi:hypothetical protein
MEKEFEDHHIVVVEHGLELDDVLDVLVEFFAGDELVDVRDEDVFVVRTVEDLDHSASGDLGVDAPEEVMQGLLGGGLPKAGYVAALWIDAREDVADGPIFAGRVHALQNDQESLLLACIENLLQVGEILPVRVEDVSRGIFVFK